MKKTKINPDWKKTMTESTDQILLSVDSLLTILRKNKKDINKSIKVFGASGAGVHELFERLTIELDSRTSAIWDIIDDD